MKALLASFVFVTTGILVFAQPLMNNEAIELQRILNQYQTECLELFKKANAAEWEAMTTGKEEAFKRCTAAKLEYAKYHSNREQYAKIKTLFQRATSLSAVDKRAAEKMLVAYEQNQLPPELLQKMQEMSSEIEMIFQNFRGKLDGKEYSNNDLLEAIEAETDSAKRQQIWEALKQVGEQSAAKIVALAKVRNQAAKQLGFKNYWEMQVHFQEYKPQELLAIFEELDKLTKPLFVQMKNELDAELAEKFGIAPEKLMPWHYDNPFFQQAPPSKEINTNIFFEDKTEEDIIAIAVKYFKHLGLDFETILKNSDMFYREGKNQHAFSIDMDTLGDVRNLCNVRPTSDWMETVLHEAGHGVYSLGHNRNLPFNLRDPAHIFTTEGVAMLLGAKAREPKWLSRFADVDEKETEKYAAALKKQRIREQLIFCRWTLVMLNFEKMLYENPDAGLVKLWQETVEKYQLLNYPKEREQGDWASKPHFVIAPVYYHNYMLGELFAAQLRRSLGTVFQNDEPKAAVILNEKVFAPGALYPWREFVKQTTGEPLSPKAFAEELR
ncbi:MAG: M2 family metallopeptidase [Planctomycetaceae bacterium]|nr:M2 family metallopeptidase [Planctomycetaceae bacterium]